MQSDHLTLRLVAEIPLKRPALRTFVVSIVGQETPDAIVTCEARSSGGAKGILWRCVQALKLDEGGIQRSDLRAKLLSKRDEDLYKRDYSVLAAKFREFDLEYRVKQK